jgi:murein DD-endopeptidase MepM/ murein hydrolase activator NlpD
MDRHIALAYELHMTNFDDAPLILQRVTVSADADTRGTANPLLDLAGQDLFKATEWVGGAQGDKAMNPGTRVIVYLWIELSAGRAAPATLRHQIVFSPAAQEGKGADVVLEGFPVPVNRQTAQVFGLPFNGGVWLAGDGPGNQSTHRRSIIAIDGGVHIAQRFAIDWVKVGPNGDSHHDAAARNENWWGYGEPVLAVGDGEITEVVDEIPDNVPHTLPDRITLDNIAGNHIILRVGNAYVTYAHLQRGSIAVHPHDQVHRGAVLARLGNSGQATAPHLHLQVTDRNSVLQSEGMPFLFQRFVYLGPGSSYELDKHPSIPWQNSAPPGDAVVEFESVVH